MKYRDMSPEQKERLKRQSETSELMKAAKAGKTWKVKLDDIIGLEEYYKISNTSTKETK